jgi:hypothetical protein
MIRRLQNEADAARTATWRRYRQPQGAAVPRGPGVMPVPGPAVPAGIASSVAGTVRATTAPITGKGVGVAKARPTPMPTPIILRLLDRLPVGTDPLHDVALVRVIDRKSGEACGPMNALLVRDLAKGVAEGSLRLENANPPDLSQAREWMAPRHFEGVMRRLISRIRRADIAEGGGDAWTRPGELLCKTAQALRVPNTDGANDRFIDAVWSSEHGADLGSRPNARTLTSTRAAVLRRNTKPLPTFPHGTKEVGGVASPNRRGGPRAAP